MGTFDKIDLESNKIDENLAESILEQLSHSSKSLNLLNNNIGEKGCLKMASILISKETVLQNLNLEGNRLTDALVSPIL